MGTCYWHGCEVYPGHPCPECEEKIEKFEDTQTYQERNLLTPEERLRKEESEE